MNCKLFFIFIIFCYHGNVAKSSSIQKGFADFASPNCKSIVCEQAHEQAKGLSKLALLDEFVSQTIFLLNDLMKNIDGELEKSANSLLRYIHPHCNSTQKILLEVIQKQKEKQFEASPVLSQGIKPMAEDKVEESTQRQNQGHNYQFPGDDDDGQGSIDKNDDDYSQKNYNYDTEDGIEEQPFSNYDTSGTVNRNSGGVYVTKDIPKEDKFSSGWNSQKSEWRGVSQEEEDKKRKQDKAWKFESTDRLSTGHKSREGKVIKTETQRIDGGTTSNKVCEGVGRDSAFWVPGLDQWCLDNCSKGYCPKTHCICFVN